MLFEKIRTSTNFRRFTVTEIIAKTWNLRVRVQNEKLRENIFKFGCKKDRDMIFRGRPWSLNGAYLILKEWPREKTLF